jgi:hypothetical protein
MTPKEAQELLILVGEISSYLSLVPLLCALYRFSTFRQKPYLYLLLYFAVGALLNWSVHFFVEYVSAHYDEWAPLLTRWEIDDTFFADPLYFLRNALLLGAFVYGTLPYPKLKRSVLIASILVVVFTLWNTFWGETYKDYQSIGNTLDNLYKTFLGVSLLYWIFRSNLNRSLSRIPQYWFAIAILIIACGSGLVDVISNRMFEQTSVLFHQLHVAKDLLLIVAFGCFTVGVLQVPHLIQKQA